MPNPTVGMLKPLFKRITCGSFDKTDLSTAIDVPAAILDCFEQRTKQNLKIIIDTDHY